MNFKFVKESDVYYLWSGFEKKLESLDSAGVVAQRVEAFDVSGLCTQGETLAEMLLVQVRWLLPQPEELSFSRGDFFLFLFFHAFS